VRTPAAGARGAGLLVPFRFQRMPSFKTFRAPVILAATALLAGCNMVVLNPSGDVASQQGRLVMIATGLMLLIIIPVIVLTLLFAWRYRAANKDADYQPDWHHSTRLELVIWSAPLLIIIALGALTWISTHTLDPYRPLDRVAAGKPVAADVKPLEIQVVSLDWKWLFIYPERRRSASAKNLILLWLPLSSALYQILSLLFRSKQLLLRRLTIRFSEVEEVVLESKRFPLNGNRQRLFLRQTEFLFVLKIFLLNPQVEYCCLKQL
jgi:heme/copper-type cytochrome/quinol oxidase subunit 2